LRAALERLLESVSQGPRLGHVTEVTRDWQPAAEADDGFEIRW
jgi:hypothetical protein